MFNKSNTRIVGQDINTPRKSTEQIKLERINLDRQIYGLKKEESVKLDTRRMLEIRRNLNK